MSYLLETAEIIKFLIKNKKHQKLTILEKMIFQLIK
tara:strand:- start:400 stop:507 length:108 start_codon:yes stop_codon:yes gene_type:complete